MGGGAEAAPAAIGGAPVCQAGRFYRGHGAAALAPAEQALAHAAEKAGVARRVFGAAGTVFKLADARVRALERFVLHQHGLHQRVGRVGSLPQAVPDQALGVRIALGILQRRQAVEQIDDEIAFLWGHLVVSFPVVTTRVM